MYLLGSRSLPSLLSPVITHHPTPLPRPLCVTPHNDVTTSTLSMVASRRPTSILRVSASLRLYKRSRPGADDIWTAAPEKGGKPLDADDINSSEPDQMRTQEFHPKILPTNIHYKERNSDLTIMNAIPLTRVRYCMGSFFYLKIV